MKSQLAISLAFCCFGTQLLAEEPAEPNLEFEKLKPVMEPFIGTWHRIGESTRTPGHQSEILVKFYWAPSKKVVIGESRIRSAPTVAELAQAEWRDGSRQYLIWNHTTGKIERYSVGLVRGRVTIWEDIENGGAKAIRSTGETTAHTFVGRYVETTIDGDTMTSKYTNRKDGDGKPLPDSTYVYTRQ